MIDSGSYANVVLAELVSKLGLQVQQHPNQCALHWLSHQVIAHVHKQVRIPLGIGDYTYRILYDV